MSDKKGSSEHKKDFFSGKEYEQHYDEDGNEISSSEHKKDFFTGKEYEQLYDKDGNEIGSTEHKRDFFSGKEYEQLYDKDGNKIGSTEHKKDFFSGREYEQHYDKEGNKIGESENKKEFFSGRRYTEHTGDENIYNRPRKRKKDEDEKNDGTELLIKLIGGIVIIAFILWLIFGVLIPLIIINIAIISLIVSLYNTSLRKYFLPLSFLGAILIEFDYNKGWFTKALVGNVSFFSSAIPFFYYINIASGLIAAYLFIQEFVNQKSKVKESNIKISKRNIIIFSSVFLVGVFTILFQICFLSNSDKTDVSAFVQETYTASNSSPASTNNVANNLQPSNSNARTFKVISRRAYFYKDPSGNQTSGAFVITGDEVTVSNQQNGFTFSSFTNNNGIQTSGWIKNTDLNYPSSGLLDNTLIVKVRRTYFYETPASNRMEAFLIRGDKIQNMREENGFVYTEFLGPSGMTTKGWINKSDLINPDIPPVKIKATFFNGSVGNLSANYSITWNQDGSIDGTYYYPNRPNITYKLKGKILGDGNIQMTEFTNDNVSANCNLSLQGSCYIGQMNNMDGRQLSMTMCPSSNLQGRFPEASQGVLSESELNSMSKYDLKIMRNEIFARHGFIFKTIDMKNYFSEQFWYHASSVDVTSSLTWVEQQNIELIKKHE